MAVKKKRGAKAAKAKKQAKKSSKLAKTDTDLTFHVKDGPAKDAPEKRDPAVPAKRAQLASKGRAVIQRARTAEREQRRLHGTQIIPMFRGQLPCLFSMCASVQSASCT